MTYKEKWIKDLGEEEGLKKWNDFQNRPRKKLEPRKDKWIRELGEEEGLKKWEKYRETMSKSHSGSFKGRWIKKYGEEEGLRKWEEYSDRLSKENSGTGNPMAGKSLHDVWTDKYGKEAADQRLVEFKETMSEVTSGEKNPMYGTKSPMPRGISTYTFWLRRYGKEEADRREIEWKKKLSVTSSGKNNPMYGRSPGHSAGLGYAGKYKGWYFRSLLELSYMIGVIEKEGLAWDNGEKKKYMVPYTSLKGVERTYKPDFFLPDEKKIIEIKPLYALKIPSVQHKIKVSTEYYEKIGYHYEVVTPEMLATEQIQELYENGSIIFGPRNKKKVEAFFAKQNKEG